MSSPSWDIVFWRAEGIQRAHQLWRAKHNRTFSIFSSSLIFEELTHLESVHDSCSSWESFFDLRLNLWYVFVFQKNLSETISPGELYRQLELLSINFSHKCIFLWNVFKLLIELLQLNFLFLHLEHWECVDSMTQGLVCKFLKAQRSTRLYRCIE